MVEVGFVCIFISFKIHFETSFQVCFTLNLKILKSDRDKSELNNVRMLGEAIKVEQIKNKWKFPFRTILDKGIDHF